MRDKRKGYFCCLGVLADQICPDYRVWDSSSRFSSEEREELGLPKKKQDELIWLNDTKRASFDKIADYIERYI
jgi:hypothetical protein